MQTALYAICLIDICINANLIRNHWRQCRKMYIILRMQTPCPVLGSFQTTASIIRVHRNIQSRVLVYALQSTETRIKPFYRTRSADRNDRLEKLLLLDIAFAGVLKGNSRSSSSRHRSLGLAIGSSFSSSSRTGQISPA